MGVFHQRNTLEYPYQSRTSVAVGGETLHDRFRLGYSLIGATRIEPGIKKSGGAYPRPYTTFMGALIARVEKARVTIITAFIRQTPHIAIIR